MAIIERTAAGIVIVRGLPGSGKSTLARSISGRFGHAHFETDMYLETAAGYSYSVERFEAAKVWCMKSVKDALARGSKAVVSNVFDRIEHMEPFLGLGADYLVIECTQQYGSVHSVPEAAVANMRLSWQPFHGAVQL